MKNLFILEILELNYSFLYKVNQKYCKFFPIKLSGIPEILKIIKMGPRGRSNKKKLAEKLPEKLATFFLLLRKSCQKSWQLFWFINIRYLKNWQYFEHYKRYHTQNQILGLHELAQISILEPTSQAIRTFKFPIFYQKYRQIFFPRNDICVNSFFYALLAVLLPGSRFM